MDPLAEHGDQVAQALKAALDAKRRSDRDRVVPAVKVWPGTSGARHRSCFPARRALSQFGALSRTR